MNPLNCQSIGRYRQSVCLGRRRKLDRDEPSWALPHIQFCLWLNVRVLANINESDVSLTSKEQFWAQWKFIILARTVEQGVRCNKNQILSSCLHSSHGFITYLELNLYLYQSFRVLLNLPPALISCHSSHSLSQAFLCADPWKLVKQELVWSLRLHCPPPDIPVPKIRFLFNYPLVRKSVLRKELVDVSHLALWDKKPRFVLIVSVNFWGVKTSTLAVSVLPTWRPCPPLLGGDAELPAIM